MQCTFQCPITVVNICMQPLIRKKVNCSSTGIGSSYCSLILTWIIYWCTLYFLALPVPILPTCIGD